MEIISSRSLPDIAMEKICFICVFFFHKCLRKNCFASSSFSYHSKETNQW